MFKGLRVLEQELIILSTILGVVKMNQCFESPPYRPPNEALSLLLRLTRGCPWNRCGFCMMYRDMQFSIRGVEEVKEDIDNASRLYGQEVRKVFIGDSDSLTMATDDLVRILTYLHSSFPKLNRVTSYARIKTIIHKPLRELKRICKSGLTRIHVGLESGSDRVLSLFKKGAGSEDMIAGAHKAMEAGLELSEYVLIGMGGAEYSRVHAQETARVLNCSQPDFIRIRTLVPLLGTAVAEMIERGEFTPLGPLERLEETKELIEGLRLESNLYSDHVSNYLQTPARTSYQGVRGRLPGDKKDMLQELKRALSIFEKNPELVERLILPNRL